MDVQDVAALDDQEFRRLITQHAHYTVGDPDVWRVLHSPELVARTRDMLTTVYNQLISSMRRRQQELDRFHQECLDRGPRGKEEWFVAKQRYEQQRGRLVSFHRALQARLTETTKALKSTNRARSVELSTQARESLRDLALAVQRHQAAHARSGTIAEQCDYELWRLLDRLTVPVGPDHEQVPLRTMVDFYWTEVDAVTPAQASAEALEPVMRSAPAGRSSAYSGVPRARHVGNGKKLA